MDISQIFFYLELFSMLGTGYFSVSELVIDDYLDVNEGIDSLFVFFIYVEQILLLSHGEDPLVH